MKVYDNLFGIGAISRQFARWPAPRAALRLHGPDAAEFLHRLCSQDVTGMAPGECRPAAFFSAKGKLESICQLGRGRYGYWLDLRADAADALAVLLDRYHFTEQLTIERPGGLLAGEVLGNAVPAALRLGEAICEELEGGGVVLTGARRGISWARYHAPEAFFANPPWSSAVPLPGQLDDQFAEVLRICAGTAALGRDTEPTTLGLEADLDDHVSTTKGCYTGQEIVARIHTYGHVNRKLCRLELATAVDVEIGTPLVETEAGDPVGRVMTSARLPDGQRRVALGYLPRDFWDVGTALRLAVLDGPVVRVF